MEKCSHPYDHFLPYCRSCGQRTDIKNFTDAIQQDLSDRFNVLFLIGMGANGPVFLCESLKDGKSYAIKILRKKRYLKKDTSYTKFKELLSLFKSKKPMGRHVLPMTRYPSLEYIDKLKDYPFPPWSFNLWPNHEIDKKFKLWDEIGKILPETIDNNPCVVQIIDMVEAYNRDILYLITEYLPGLTLRQFLNHHRAFGERILLKETQLIIQQVLYGLHCIHTNLSTGHGDVRPENIMVLENISHRPYAGIHNYGRLFWATLFDGILYGDSHYIEGYDKAGDYWIPLRYNALGGSEAIQNDLYNVGLILYELILRHLPLPGYELPSKETNGQVPVSVDDWLLRVWNKGFKNAMDALKELEKIEFHWEFGSSHEWYYPIEDYYS